MGKTIFGEQESKQEVTKVISLVKDDGISFKYIRSPTS